ncbi:phage Gp37/Gp68 family protein [Agrobacterium tumefaciens]|uniref:DUF5131 family protein n=1 Tax=Agrobacterium tumefaciens TaxID=358 RepID=UPI000EF288B2|nr:hypothetical protein At1D1108_34730 [Agrobacterium tumefaciens]NSY92241.1 phage Gp37/Gp68 family protein [Agrobacterium tumefaciens]
MADGTDIEWTDATWNPITGCSVVSPGCTNCYAMKLAGTRLKHTASRKGLTSPSKSGPVWNGAVKFNEGWLRQPLEWKRPRMIFVCAHGDLFAENVPEEWIDRVFAVMAVASRHTFQVLTKRPERMLAYLNNQPFVRRRWESIIHEELGRHTVSPPPVLPNVWAGVSAEDQSRADERIPLLLQTPAAMRWVSIEPMLGGIDLLKSTGGTLWMGGQRGCSGAHRHHGQRGEVIHDRLHETDPTLPHHHHDERCGKGIDWVVLGGESGPKARPMHPLWAQSIRDQCQQADVPFFFKQWGAWKPVPWKLDRDKDETDAEYVERSERECSTFAISQSGYLIEMDHKPWSWARVLPAPSSHHSVKPVGKKAAGRLLDGIVHDAFPKIERTI